MTALYKDGTVTLVQGSPVIVGNDTGWKVALIVGGTVFVEAEGGSPMPILPDDSEGANLHPITNTQMTAAINWTGASGTYNYALVRDMSYSRQQSANADALALYLQRLNNPSLAAVSGLVPEADSLILFTGPDTATVIQRSSLVQGVDYDADADNIAGRNLYSSEAKGFSVLVANAGDGRTALFIKRSSTDGDWSVPFYLSGPIGPKGDTGATGIVDKGTYVATDVYAARDAVLDNGSTWLARIAVPPGNPPPVLPATQNDYWRLLARRGIDGTGIGDVVGPNGGVANNAPAAFDGTTGKLIKVITGAIAALHALTPAANKLPYFTGAGAAALTDLTALARSLLDDADGATMFATMGVTFGTNWILFPNKRLFQWGTTTGTMDGAGQLGVPFPTSYATGASYNVVAFSGDTNVAGGFLLFSQLRATPWPQAGSFAIRAMNTSSQQPHANQAVRVDWIAMGVAP